MLRSEVDVLTPQTLDEALDMLHRNGAGLKIVAGGSDVIVQLRDGIIQTNMLMNIFSLKELRFIRLADGLVRVGSLSTYSDIVRSETIQRHGCVLAEAARQIGAAQLQNTATIGGNLGNASPAGDSLPPLYALDATVVTRSRSANRRIPIDKFFVAYRKTAARNDELIEEVDFTPLGPNDRGSYMKLGLREANAISIVDVAVVLKGRKPDNSFDEVRIAMGAVAPTIRRATRCEQELAGKPLTFENIRRASLLASADASPIDDTRGSAQYRRSVLASLVFQTLHRAVTEGNREA